MNRRSFLAVAALGAVTVACKDQSGTPDSTTSTTGGTSAPDTGVSDSSTTSTTASPTVPVTEPTTTDPVVTSPSTEPIDTEPGTTEPSATDVPTTPPGSGLPDLSGGFEVAEAPSVPLEQTMAIPADNMLNGGFLGGPLADGVYAGSLDGLQSAPAPGVIMKLVQLFFGQACIRKAAEMGDECVNDIFALDDPSGLYTALVADLEHISVVRSDTQENFSVTYAEFEAMLNGDTPPSAPSGFLYTDFGWMITISGGRITRLEQLWTP